MWKAVNLLASAIWAANLIALIAGERPNDVIIGLAFGILIIYFAVAAAAEED